MSLCDTIQQKLEAEFSPVELQVDAISIEEQKYSVYIVSAAFNGVSVIKRHKMINSVFMDELLSGTIHALSITAECPPST